jgi:5-methyltetrahydrofolate corrinoid/iron sulfur protein methyltransferase
MQIIANNITSRNPRIANILRQQIRSDRGNIDSKTCPDLADVAESCLAAGADILEINLQQHYDEPEVMELAINSIQNVTSNQLCLSSNKSFTIERGLQICRRPPIINYVAIDTVRLQEMLPLAAKYKSELILLVSDPSVPADAKQMLEKAVILVGAANASGIPNERLILDPGLFHITKEQGQQHLVEIREFLMAVEDVVEPPIRTTCWISNSSAGAPTRLKPVIEVPLLAMLSGLGLSSVFLDILKSENQRLIRLLKIFNNEEVYADGVLSL